MYKKLGIVLICYFLFFSHLLTTKIALASIGSATISNDSVNVREGPGLSYPIVKKANKGESYPILEEKGDWIQISLTDGKSGWVANWLVSRTKKEESQQQSSTAVVNTNDLRVRNGPGTSFQIIGYLNKGEKVQVKETNENWVRINAVFGDGWVSKQFISFNPLQNNKTDKSKETTTTEGIIQTNSLNVRSKPSLDSTILGKLQKDSKVKVFTQNGKWTEISFLNQRAWISSQYIVIQTKNGSKTPVPAKISGIIGTITAESLNLRSSPSLNGSITGTVKKGQAFKIVEEVNNWAKLEIKNSQYGWVAGWYLEKSSEESKAPQGQPVKESTVSILHNGTNIRKSASVESEVMIRANEGDTFSVKALKNNWYEIVLKDGSSGFVAGWIVTVNGSAPQVEKPGAEMHLKNKTVILDPGHGGGDNGTTGARGTQEKELTIRTATLLYDKLKASGANVIVTRSNDTYLSLRSRVSTAHYHNADAFISIHYDSITDRSVRGMTSYYYHSYQKKLAETMHSSVISQVKLKDRGSRFGDYHVLRENRQPAVLLELGYLSNPAEEIAVNTGQYQEAAASGIFNGLARYFKEY